MGESNELREQGAPSVHLVGEGTPHSHYSLYLGLDTWLPPPSHSYLTHVSTL